MTALARAMVELDPLMALMAAREARRDGSPDTALEEAAIAALLPCPSDLHETIEPRKVA